MRVQIDIHTINGNPPEYFAIVEIGVKGLPGYTRAVLKSHGTWAGAARHGLKYAQYKKGKTNGKRKYK